MTGAMKRDILLGVVAATAGLLSGSLIQPAIVGSLPAIGWSTIVTMFVIAALALPGTLVLLSMGERYEAMALSWTVFFLIGVFFLSAGAGALALAASPPWAIPSSYLLLAWGAGALSSLTLLKLWLARLGAKKAARAAASSDEAD
jgi:hypothetical protein